MTKGTKMENSMERILDLMVDDLLETPGDELIQEALEDGCDFKSATQEVHTLIQEAVFEHNRSKLEEAKRQVENNKSQSKPILFAVEASKKRAIFTNLSTNDNTAGLTLAARKEADLSDSDIDSALQDMLELGLIDENGNICD